MNITSLNNEKVKKWLKLKEKKYRDQTGLFLVESEHLVKEALAKKMVQEIISLTGFSNECPEFLVTSQIMKLISSQVTMPQVCAVCKKMPEKPETDKVLILDNIQDPGNLGALIRSAVAFNFSTIVLSHDSVDLYNEKVIRSCEGMLFHANILRKDLLSYLPTLKEKGYEILGTDVNKGIIPEKIAPWSKMAIILGNEGKGIRSQLKKIIEKNIFIPMNDKCESLNVAICGALIMYEINKGMIK